MKQIFLVFHFLFSSLLCCWSQVEEHLGPAERKQLTIVTEPQTLFKGFFRSAVGLSYGTIDKIFNSEGKREALASNVWANNWFAQLFLTYGITDRLQADLQMTYRLGSIYQSLKIETPDLGETTDIVWKSEIRGFGDLTASVAYQLWTETATRPSITLFATGTFPTGEKNPTNINPENPKDYSLPTGSGEFSLNSTIRLRKVNYPYVYSAFVSYQYFTGGKKILDTSETQERSFKSGPNLSIGGYFNFHLNEWIAVRNSFDYFFSQADTFDGVVEPDNSWVLQYYPGLSFQIKRLRIDQAVVVALRGKLVAADPSYILVVMYTF